MAEKGEDEQAYITRKEAETVLSGQIQIYQHTQDQALSILKMAFTFIGVFIATLSIVISNFDPSHLPPGGIPVRNPDYVDSDALYRLVYLAYIVSIVGFFYGVRDLYDGVKGAINLLSAPDLKPFSSEETDVRVIDRSSISDGSQYEKWMEDNREVISERNSDIAGVHSDLRSATFLWGWSIPIASFTYFAPFTLPLIVSLAVSAGFLIGLLKLLKGRVSLNKSQSQWAEDHIEEIILLFLAAITMVVFLILQSLM